MSFVNLKNGKFFYKILGKGHPIVCISGYTCDHAFWLPVAEIMKEHFQMVLFDNQGVGVTEDHGGALSADVMADDVMELIHALKLEKPHIFGQSMGGTIVQSIGARHGKEVGKLAILASTAKWRHHMTLGLQSFNKMMKLELDPKLVFEASIPWFFGEAFLSDKAKIKALWEIMSSNPHPQSLKNRERQFEVILKFDGIKQLSSIHNPTLILYAKEDIVALPSESEFMAQHIPNAKIEACDSGHALIVEIPDVVAGKLTRFLNI